MNPLEVYLHETQSYWAIRLNPNSNRKIGYISKTRQGYMAIHNPANFNLNEVAWTPIDHQPVNGGRERYTCQLNSFEECLNRIINTGINVHFQ